MLTLVLVLYLMRWVAAWTHWARIMRSCHAKRVLVDPAKQLISLRGRDQLCVQHQTTLAVWGCVDRLAVMTSAVPYLPGFSIYTASLRTYASALMTCKNCSCKKGSLCLGDKAQLGIEGHSAVRACVMCVLQFD